MTLLLTTLIILTCVLLVIIVLVQNPKGGGLSSTFGGGGGTQLFGGVKKTTDFLDRGTWVLALALVILVMTSNIMLDPNSGAEELRGSALDNVEIADPVPAAGQSFDFPSEVTEEPAATTTEEE